MGVGAAASARRRGVIAGLVFVILGLGVAPAIAQTNWEGDVSSAWATPGNWSSGVPGGALINGANPNAPIYSTGTTTIQYLSLGTSLGQTGTLSITGGALTVNGNRPGDTFYNTVIGDYGSGSLTISGGGQLTSTYGFLGYNLPAAVGDLRSNGSVTITGTNSKWSMSFLDIGSSGTGLINIENGGALASTGQINLGRDTGARGTLNVKSGSTATGQTVRIGAVAAGSGAVTVDGAGSVFTATNAMTVGTAGVGTVNGTLAVTNGGKVAVTNGLDVTGRGTATVDGSTSRIEAGSITVTRADGLTVTNGGTVASAGGLTVSGTNGLVASTGSVVTSGSGSVSGTASFTGNSTWTVTNRLTISGTGGGGVLTVASGADVSAGSAELGGSGTSGKVTVDGAGSTFTVAGTLDSARFTGGSATLEATNGGQVTLGGLTHLQAGTFTVSGANSRLTVTGNAQFGGNAATTTVTVSGGGTVVTGVIANETAPVTPTPAQFGAVAGGTANATVTGTGSSWTNYGLMTVGGSGTGTLTVTNGASAYSTRMNVAGSGTGTLTISGGGQVTAGTLTLASSGATGNGTVVVTGAGSKLTLTEDNSPFALDVGYSGTGRLEVLAGGVVQARKVEAGGFTNGSGSILVSGTGSRITATEISLGTFSPATLTVASGGRVDATGIVRLSSGTLADPGTIALDSGTLVTADAINFGKSGGSVTRLTASNGSVIQSNSATLAQNASDNSSATLSGNSTWTVTRDLTVADRGKGVLNLSGGADLSVGTFISVGWMANSEGTISARGAGTTITTTSTTSGLLIGGFTSAGGQGTVIVSDGASITLNGPATIHSTGLLQIGEGAAPGQLHATALAVNGELRLNHTGTLTVDAPLSGTGTINKYGSGTSTFTGVSTFAGNTRLYGGKLVIGQGGGSLASSSVFVESGAILGGIGTLGPTTVLTGGIHAPGNSIGTVTINGNYANAGRLEIEVDEFGNSDRVVVNGTVDVSQATLRIVPVAGAGWIMNQTYTYTVIDNDGVDAVAPFASVENLAFFSSNVIYNGGTGNDVVLALTCTSATFAQLGTTPNQRATAVGLNSVPSGAALPSALSFLTVAGANPVLDQLSGEIHATVAGVALDLSRLPRDTALSRIGSAMDGDGTNYWGRALGSLGSLGGDGNAAAVGTATAGVIAGADGWVTGDLFLGVELGFTQTGIGQPARSASAALQTAHLGIYGGASYDDVRARFGANVSLHGAQVSRTPSVTGVGGTLTSNYAGATAQLFGELGYAIALQDVTLEPYVGLTLVTSTMGAYAETGGIAAVSGQSASLGAAIATVGLRASTEFQFRGRTGKASAAVGVESGPAMTPTATHAFTGGSPFSVAGAGSGPRLKLEAGLSAPLSDSTSLDFTYRGTIGTGSADSALSLTISGKF